MDVSELFRRWGSVEEHKAKRVIFREREPAEVIFVVLSGEVELSLKGKRLATETAGGVIGEMALLPSSAHSTTATALTPVKLARLDRQQLASFAGSNVEFSLHIMAVLAKRLRATDQYISAQIEQSR